MQTIRRHLEPLLIGWLLVQACALAPAVALTAATMIAGDEVCTCQDSTPGTTCPMHHRAGAGPKSAGGCAMQQAHGHLDVALLSLVEGAAVLPQTAALPIQTVQGGISLDDVPFSSRTDVPDSPPPRV